MYTNDALRCGGLVTLDADFLQHSTETRKGMDGCDVGGRYEVRARICEWKVCSAVVDLLATVA